MFLICSAVFGQSEIRIVVKDGQTVRDIAREYLKDPDLWEEILRSNNFKSPEQIKPGMTLLIPVESILKAKNQINKASEAINTATEAGGKTFAAQTITQAIELYNAAIAQRKAGNWKKSYELAVQSERTAIEAKNIAESKSKTGSDATVAYGKGKIESKKPAEPLWKNAPVLSKLFENDRLRTLSNSFAEILFQDKSKIKLSENSQLVIQKARIDLLKNRSESEVKLEKGNAFAFLSGKSPKKDFKVSVTGAETEINSKAFFLQKEEKSTKIANYDGEISLKGKGKSVIVKENQGSIVSDNGNVSDPKNLLPSPQLRLPENNGKMLADTIFFEWSSVSGIKHYWLSIASDQEFNDVVFSSKSLTVPSQKVNLEPGVYYWRVASEDAEGFPGPYAKFNTLYIQSKSAYAYLVILEPQPEFVSEREEITVVGTTDINNKVAVNNVDVPVDPVGGKFSIPVKLTKGLNTISIRAVNPTGGENTISLKVKYEIDSIITLSFDESLLVDASGNFVLLSPSFVLHGNTNVNAQVTLRSTTQNYHLRTSSDENGNFAFTIQRFSQPDTFITSVVSRSGYSKSFTNGFVLDQLKPKLSFESEPPSYTNQKQLQLSGFAENVVEMKVNTGEIVLTDSKFSYTLELNSGINNIDLTGSAKNGRTASLKRSVYLDLDPPEMGNFSCVPAKVTEAESTVQIIVNASDVSGLKRTAKIIYLIEEEAYSVTLLYNNAAGNYQGKFPVKGKLNAEIQIKSVLLEDYFGNYKEYKLR